MTEEGGRGAALLRRLRRAAAIYEGIYFAPYRSVLRREYLRHHDFLLLLGASDLLGVPNPIQFYTLELIPEALERYHEWHLRLGLESAPEGGFRCC